MAKRLNERRDCAVVEAKVLKAAMGIASKAEGDGKAHIARSADEAVWGKQLLIRTSDGTQGVDVPVASEVFGEFNPVMVDARRLAALVGTLGNDPVTLVPMASALRVVMGGSKYDLPITPAEEYPRLPQRGPRLCGIHASELIRMIGAVTHAACKDSVFPNINGICMEFDPAEETLHLVATDRHRMAVAKTGAVATGGVGAKSLEETTSRILCLAAANQLEALLREVVGLKDEAAHVEAYAAPTTVTFETSIGTFTARVNAGKFPPWRRVYEQPRIARHVFDREALHSALARLVAVSDKDSHNQVVFLLTNDGRLGIESRGRHGRALEVIPCLPQEDSEGEEIEDLQKGEEIRVRYNVLYVLDAVRAVEGVGANRVDTIALITQKSHAGHYNMRVTPGPRESVPIQVGTFVQSCVEVTGGVAQGASPP